MKTTLVTALLLFSIVSLSYPQVSKKDDAWKSIYRETPAMINDLVNTKLEVSFSFEKSWMYGKAWLTLHPHFYPTDSLRLDTKGMTINEVSLINAGKKVPLKYTYDSLNLRITLDRTYREDQNFTVYIDYISRPNERKSAGSAAISGDKGLYFVNPTGKTPNKPTQIWTQGETESNSCWVPTIDKPNQKTTSEISITVPDKYKTLSNGLLIKQKKNKDGSRTDLWKMDLPHAPYLMMMAIGEYSVIKDSYKGKEVSYYVEKEYEPVARKIFGYTPEMIALFSRLTGVDYPWQKYAQIVVRDYVSGAMENTTATVHGSSAQQDARALVDANQWEDVISHELFHMWFGDYVTTESWSNLTINESFADFSELLWEDYKHGRDASDEHNFEGMQGYFFSMVADRDLVRFYYSNREDMFDAVSYQKGGRILNMLRNYVGDTAFFRSVNLFLTTHRFKSAEATELRLAFEEVTGQDLNWFFNQWYYGSGHPKLDISYDYDQSKGIAKVFVRQTQTGKTFRLPVAVDVYQGGKKVRYKMWLEHQADTLLFPSQTRPDLINVDGDKILLCEKSDHKTSDNFIFQYKNAGIYMDRREAIDYAVLKQTSDSKAAGLMLTALNDRYKGLRIYAIQRLNLRNDSLKGAAEPVLAGIANNDPVKVVRAAAIRALGNYKNNKYKELFNRSINDSSYSVSGNALTALAMIDSTSAISKAKELSLQKVKGELSRAIDNVLYTYAGENDFDSLAARFDRLPSWNSKIQLLQPFAGYLKKIRNPDNFKKGIDMIVQTRESVPREYNSQAKGYFNNILSSIAAAKKTMGLTELEDYVKAKMVVNNPPPDQQKE
jgi:aminopeptidase N